MSERYTNICVNPKFWQDKVCLWVYPMEEKSGWLVGRQNRSLDGVS